MKRSTLGSRKTEQQQQQQQQHAAHNNFVGHDKMRSGADLRGGMPLVSFSRVIDPHFVTFSSSLYTTIRNSKPIPPNHNPNPNPA